MKAIIMAGGEGSRLRPLTCDCPKPMMRLLDRPVMEYALKLLKKHGVREAAVTLGYLPDAIVDFFGDGGDWGLSLRYYTERTPLGTAGGVRQAADFLDETFCVLSGDGVTDLDLSAALAFHRERGALATMVLTRVPDPLEYGLVIPAADGRVRAFVEKPGPGEAISDTVNTGIYILEPDIFAHIPEGKPCDFGGELFPRLVGEGKAVYGCVLEGYWCDIGDVGAYLRAHADLLEGKLKLETPAGVQRGALVDEGRARGTALLHRRGRARGARRSCGQIRRDRRGRGGGGACQRQALRAVAGRARGARGAGARLRAGRTRAAGRAGAGV